jgi:hypothetical protein
MRCAVIAAQRSGAIYRAMPAGAQCQPMRNASRCAMPEVSEWVNNKKSHRISVAF